MQTFWQDLRFGVRMLTKKPGFTLIAIVTLALGIGANAAIFTVINAVAFKPLPYPNEARLVVIREHRTDDASDSKGVSFPNFTDWKSRNSSFESMAIVSTDTATVRGESESLRVEGAIVSADFFKILGIQPMAGRLFTPSDELPGSSEGLMPVVLTHSGWKKHFSGDERAVGKTLIVEEQPAQVIGITPPGIFPLEIEPMDFFLPSVVNGNLADPNSINGSRNFRAYPGVVARLKPGVSLHQAETELASIQSALSQQYPKAMANRVVRVELLRDLFVRDVRGTLWLLLGIVGTVLLIACVNVANVLLARAAGRQREIAIRSALGASRWDIVRQFLVESLQLALAGGALGVLFSMWLVEGLVALLPAEIPRLTGLQPDWRVLLFTFGATLLTGLLCGLLPSITATKSNLADAIKEGGRNQSGHGLRGRLRNALVIGEVALALPLLVTAGLLVNSLLRLTEVRPGFDTGNTLTMELSLSGSRYNGEMNNPEAMNRFLSAMTESVRALPGVVAVAHAQCVPLTGQENNTGFELVATNGASNEKPSAQLRFISAGYFNALSIPFVSGRDFSELDTPQSPPVMLVNEAFVREHFSGENPLGKKLKLGWGGNAPKEIVGIVGDVRHRSLSDAARPEMYVPQSQWANAGVTLIVRSQGDPGALINPIKQRIRALDSEIPITSVKTLDTWRGEALAFPRFTAFLLGVFALLALTLTIVGLYGVISYSVMQRTAEIGIRMALGAQTGDVMKMVIAQGMKLVVAGTVIGSFGALALARLLQSQLYGVSPADPLTFGAIALLLAAVAFAACWFPARRAANVDPMIALRCE